jgi:hypothetical protein
MAKALRAKAAKTGVNKQAGISKSQNLTKLEILTKVIATDPVSRGKRKRALKRARIESRNEFVRKALNSKRLVDSCRSFGEALGNLEDLSAAILEEPMDEQVAKPTAQGKSRNSKALPGALKRSQKLKADQVDIDRFRALMSIPEFSNDPLGAMEKHLLHMKKREEKLERGRREASMDTSTH